MRVTEVKMRYIIASVLLLQLVQLACQSPEEFVRKLVKRGSCNSCCNSCNTQCVESTTCCNTVSCNSCCQTNSNCRTGNCPEDNCCGTSCSNKCQPQPEPSPVTVPVPIIVNPSLPPQPQPQPQPPVIVNNHANHTAVIHINNVLNNTNYIHVPVYVNTTNINNIDVEQPPQPPQTPLPAPIYAPTKEIIKVIETHDTTNVEKVLPTPTQEPQPRPHEPQKERPPCCYVIHPRVCEVLANGEKKCYMYRHRECSDICTSSVMVIQRTDRVVEPIVIPMPQPQPPPPPIIVGPVPYTPTPTPICQRIQQYPWINCANYQTQTHNCGQCYECGGMYNPQVCSKTSECSNTCRLNMLTCDTTNQQLYCL